MATKKRSRKDEELTLIIGGEKKQLSTIYEDKNGNRVEAIRCGQCKGKGCAGCDFLGFLKQETLAL